jgi:hypothetical protein
VDEHHAQLDAALFDLQARLQADGWTIHALSVAWAGELPGEDGVYRGWVNVGHDALKVGVARELTEAAWSAFRAAADEVERAATRIFGVEPDPPRPEPRADVKPYATPEETSR